MKFLQSLGVPNLHLARRSQPRPEGSSAPFNYESDQFVGGARNLLGSVGDSLAKVGRAVKNKVQSLDYTKLGQGMVRGAAIGATVGLAGALLGPLVFFTVPIGAALGAYAGALHSQGPSEEEQAAQNLAERVEPRISPPQA